MPPAVSYGVSPSRELWVRWRFSLQIIGIPEKDVVWKFTANRADRYMNRASRSLMVNSVRETADEIKSTQLLDYFAKN